MSKSIMINLYLQRVISARSEEAKKRPEAVRDQNKTGNKSAITRPSVHKEEQKQKPEITQRERTAIIIALLAEVQINE